MRQTGERHSGAQDGASATDSVNFRAVAWAFKQKVGRAGAKYVLVALARFTDSDGTCYPAQLTLAAMTEFGERTVRRHLKYLENRGLILRTPRGKADGTRDSDLYKLAGAPFEPAAKVAGSPSEQPANLNARRAAKLAGDQNIGRNRLKTFNVNDFRKARSDVDARKTELLSDEEISARNLADEILAVCGDRKSLPFYRKVARRVREETVRAALSETRLVKHEGRIRNTPGAFFVDELKRTTLARGDGELSELIGGGRRGGLRQ